MNASNLFLTKLKKNDEEYKLTNNNLVIAYLKWLLMNNFG